MELHDILLFVVGLVAGGVLGVLFLCMCRVNR